MRLMRGDGRIFGHGGLHELDESAPDDCTDCHPIRTRRMWQVTTPHRPIRFAAFPTREQAQRDATWLSGSWRQMYRQGWRCRPVIVIEEV